MDFASSRRTGATYGKALKRALVHDLFDHRSSTPVASDTHPAKIASSIASDDVTSTNHLTIREDPNQIDGGSSPVPTLSSPPAEISDEIPSRNANHNKSKVGNVFDLDSSGSDTYDSSKDKSSKRRRLKAPVRPAKSTTSETSRTQIKSVQSRVTSTTSMGQPMRSDAKSNVFENAHNKSNHQISAIAAPRMGSRRDVLTTSKSVVSRPHARHNLAVQLPAKTVVHTTLFEDPNSTDASGHLTDHSLRSVRSTNDTPKRKRPTSQHSDVSISSPSSIGFTTLKLTPERKVLTKKTILVDSMSDEDETPRKVRSRLIDRLDAPPQSSGMELEDHDFNPDSSSASAEKHATQQGGSARKILPVNAPPKDTKLISEPSQNSQPRSTYATKARTTYAKERSYLSDMMDDLDNLSKPSSQLSGRGDLLLQPSTSSLALQLELENDDSDDHSGPGRLKSIHELRRAGVNNRFDREIQGLLEDIEESGDSSKALRLQALMKLVMRMQDAAFLQHLIESNRVSRLVTCGSRTTDLSSATLIMIALLILAADAPVTILTHAFVTVMKIAPDLLATDKSLTQIVSDRKQNLSKSTVRDVIKFQDLIAGQSPISSLQSSAIYPDGIAVQCLDSTLRRCLSLGHTAPKMTSTCYGEILDLTCRVANTSHSGDDEARGRNLISALLQLLEACSLAFDEEDLKATKERYETLGTALATVMTSTDKEHQDLQQNVLRAIVSLSNNKPGICHALGQSRMLDEICSIIDQHFPTVAIQADEDQPLDQAKLDSVILALGCLLNFAECDGRTRQRLSELNQPGLSYTDRMVTIFNSQVSKVQDATTTEQSQVLVAFGYLSMVLCTMSLDRTIRSQITRLLHDQSFEGLCTAADTFFHHLRTLADLSADDASLSAFTTRFSVILDTIRTPGP